MLQKSEEKKNSESGRNKAIVMIVCNIVQPSQIQSRSVFEFPRCFHNNFIGLIKYMWNNIVEAVNKTWRAEEKKKRKEQDKKDQPEVEANTDAKRDNLQIQKTFFV